MFTHSMMALLAQVPNVEDTGLSFGWLFVKTLLAMIFIIALAIVFLRYIYPRLHFAVKRPNALIKILDRTGLDQRKALYVVQVGKKFILVGASDQNVSKVADLDPEDLGAPRE